MVVAIKLKSLISLMFIGDRDCEEHVACDTLLKPRGDDKLCC